MKTKVCSKCGKRKQVSFFFSDKRKKDGLMSSCKECHRAVCESWADKHGGSKEFARQYNQKIKGTKISFARIFSKKKYNAKQSGIPFDIEKDDFIKWYSEINKQVMTAL